MTIGKHLICSVKNTQGKKSVLLEHRGKESDTLLLEGGVAAILSMWFFIMFENLILLNYYKYTFEGVAQRMYVYSFAQAK